MKKYMFLKWMLFSLYAAQAQPGGKDEFDFSFSNQPNSNDGRIRDQVMQDQALAESLQKEEEKKRVQEKIDYMLAHSFQKKEDKRQRVEKKAFQQHRRYLENDEAWLRKLNYICDVSIIGSGEEAINYFKNLLKLMEQENFLDKGVSPTAHHIFTILCKKYSKKHLFKVMRSFFDHGLMLSNEYFHNIYYELCKQGDVENIRILHNVLKLDNTDEKNMTSLEKAEKKSKRESIKDNLALYLDAVMRRLEETSINYDKNAHDRCNNLLNFLLVQNKREIHPVSDAIIKIALKNNISDEDFHNIYYKFCKQGDVHNIIILHNVLKLDSIDEQNMNQLEKAEKNSKSKVIKDNLALYLGAVMRRLEETSINYDKDAHDRCKNLLDFLLFRNKGNIRVVSDDIIKIALKNNNLEALQLFYHKDLHNSSNSDDLFWKNYEALCDKAQERVEVAREIDGIEALSLQTEDSQAKIKELRQKEKALIFKIVQSMDTIPFLLEQHPNLAASVRDEVFEGMFENNFIYILKDITTALKEDISKFFKPSHEALQLILSTLKSKDSLNKKEREMLDYLESHSFERDSGNLESHSFKRDSGIIKEIEEERKE